jgi:hypothetical protein
MKTVWTKGIKDKDAKDEIRSAFKSSVFLRERLAEMLDAKITEKDRAAMDAEGYDCANWAYKMADVQGYKRALVEIISLITEK